MPDSSFLRNLGIVGWDAIEPVILAALATETPLLLVGPHGTAKSLLLERLAEALGLRFRHYNASIINFDDLCGFPVPDGDHVRYLRTPLDAWDAECIFIDELSRCRPDIQNRLFPIIHERRLQGATLEHLRFRWAAMNPPPGKDAVPESTTYLGAEPLDPALADRFAWIVEVPVDLSEADRLLVIRGAEPVTGAFARLVETVEEVRARLASTEEELGYLAAAYVDAAAAALALGGLPLSSRRLRILYQNVLAVSATNTLDQRDDVLRLALLWSIPQRAQGTIQDEVVLRAHLAAAKVIDQPADDARRRLLTERDPVSRVAIALTSTDVDLVTATVLEARARLSEADRLGLAAWLFPLLQRTRPALPGLVFEALSQDYAQLEVQVDDEFNFTHRMEWGQFKGFDDLQKLCQGLGQGDAWIVRVLWTARQRNYRFEPVQLLEFCRVLVRTLGGSSTQEVAA